MRTVFLCALLLMSTIGVSHAQVGLKRATQAAAATPAEQTAEQPAEQDAAAGDDDRREIDKLRADLDAEKAAHQRTQSAKSYQDLDDWVRQKAEESAAKRAAKLSWLIMPPEGIKWIAGAVYLQSLFGTTNASAPYATAFGAGLRVYPFPIGIVLGVHVGGLYEGGNGGVYKTLDHLSKLSLDIDATVGYEWMSALALHIGWGATNRSWDVADTSGQMLKLQPVSQMDHYFVIRAEGGLRGAGIGFTCRVGAARLLDTLGAVISTDAEKNTLSGMQALCGVSLTATVAGF